jgi:hypothetical protein
VRLVTLGSLTWLLSPLVDAVRRHALDGMADRKFGTHRSKSNGPA